MKKNLLRLTGLLFSVFLIIIIYMTYLQLYKADELLNHPRNKRLQLLEEAVLRGSIVDRNGVNLAYTVADGDTKLRKYPFGEVTSNITGYVSQKYGRWGLENTYNSDLLSLNGFSGNGIWAFRRIYEGRHGNNISLSIDINLQKQGFQLLGNRKGAVVAIEPQTGRVLAMVSRPGYNAERVESEWENLINNNNSPLLNRATQGLYPPGSTMKVVTAAGIIKKDPQVVDRVFQAPGYIVIEGKRINDQVKGSLTFSQALAKSSNYVFALLGLQLGSDEWVNTAQGFGLEKTIPFDVETEPGRIPEPDKMSKVELGESAIGQGRILVTPLHMALVAAAVANEGKMMKPSLVDAVVSPDGTVIKANRPKVLLNPISPGISKILKDFMVSAVSDGTGKRAYINGIEVAGKTGSAENPHGDTHAWFIGFAPADNPQIAVAVIVENGGAGGREAAPIAREIIKTALANKR